MTLQTYIQGISNLIDLRRLEIIASIPSGQLSRQLIPSEYAPKIIGALCKVFGAVKIGGYVLERHPTEDGYFIGLREGNEPYCFTDKEIEDFFETLKR